MGSIWVPQQMDWLHQADRAATRMATDSNVPLEKESSPSAGLGALTNLNGDHPSQSALHVHAIREMYRRLDEFASSGAKPSLTRPNAIALLEIIYGCLQPVMQDEQYYPDSDLTIVSDHHAIVMLEELINAFKDLDNAKPHEVFAPNAHGANASHSTAVKRQIDVLLETVEVVRLAKGLKTRKDAQIFVSNALKGKKTFRGEPVTQELLQSLLDRRNARRKQKA